jgi:hypothetical protein
LPIGRHPIYVTCGRILPHETARYVTTVQLALGELLFSQANSRFSEPLDYTEGRATAQPNR